MPFCYLCKNIKVFEYFQTVSDSAMIVLHPDRNDPKQYMKIVDSLRRTVAPRHRFEVEQNLYAYYDNGEEINLYAARVSKLPYGIGGENNDEVKYEIMYLDEKNPFNVHPNSLNTVEEAVFQRDIDVRENNCLGQLELLRGSVRIQVAYQDTSDKESHYDDINFYYYCLATSKFSTQAGDSLCKDERDRFIRRGIDETVDIQERNDGKVEYVRYNGQVWEGPHVR